MPRTMKLRLTASDWDRDLGGWRCPILGVGETHVHHLYLSGNEIDPGKYTVDRKRRLITYHDPKNKPSTIVAEVTLPGAVVPTQALDKWKKWAVLLPFIASILSILATVGVVFLKSHLDRPNAPQGPRAHPREIDRKDWQVHIAPETSLVKGDQRWLRSLANDQSVQAKLAGFDAQRNRVLVAETREVGYETKPFDVLIKPLQHRIDSCFAFRMDPVADSKSYMPYIPKRGDNSLTIDNVILKANSRLVVLVSIVSTDETRHIPFLENGHDIELEINP